ncbi:Ig-like domain-containing protein [bacterium]|nr:Ig-like domain-containing protein [bacterium]
MRRWLLISTALLLLAVLGFRYRNLETNPSAHDPFEAPPASFYKVSKGPLERPTYHALSEIQILLSPPDTTTSERSVEVHGLQPDALTKLRTRPPTHEEWSRLFLMLTQEAADNSSETLPAVSGEYTVEQNVIRFTPRFPFVDGMTYVARFNPSSFLSTYTGKTSSRAKLDADEWLEVEISLPKKKMIASTFVQHIFPSTDVVPVNLLKFYVQFSSPMSFGEAYKRIHLYVESGPEIEDAFLEVEQELWDPSQQRLTLLLDPGRIKRGLQSHQDLGLALQVGKRYRLVVDAAWPDAQGQPLTEAYEKRFEVTIADRKAPDQTNWQWTAPVAGTVGPLIITFPEPLDQALLLRLLEIRTSGDLIVGGEPEINRQETQWQFHPSEAWDAGSYTVRVNTALEDLSGNNLRAVFDVDLQKDRSASQQEYLALPFTVKTQN